MSKKSRRRYRAVIKVIVDNDHFEIECLENTDKFCRKRIEHLVFLLKPVISNGGYIECQDVGMSWTKDGMIPIEKYSWKEQSKKEIETLTERINYFRGVIASDETKNNRGAVASLKWNLDKKKFIMHLIDYYNDLN